LETTTQEVGSTKPGQLTVSELGKARVWQVLVIITAAAFIFVYWHTFRWWWGHWWADDSYYSHGILIPIMSGFLVWSSRKRLAKMVLEPSIWGLMAVLLAALVQFVSYRSAIPSVSGLTLPLVLLGGSLFLFGKYITRELLFPILFLFFMCVPPTQFLSKISFNIQMLSTTFATASLKMVGYSAQQAGTQIHLPSINVVVGAPCSGFRLLIALLAFTTFIAMLLEGQAWRRWGLIAFILPLSLLLNSARVFAIALIGEHWGEDVMHTAHDPAGYVMIVIALIIVLIVARAIGCRRFQEQFGGTELPSFGALLVHTAKRIPSFFTRR